MQCTCEHVYSAVDQGAGEVFWQGLPLGEVLWSVLPQDLFQVQQLQQDPGAWQDQRPRHEALLQQLLQQAGPGALGVQCWYSNDTKCQMQNYFDFLQSTGLNWMSL